MNVKASALVVAGVVVYLAGVTLALYLPETRVILLAPIKLLWSLR